MRARHRTFNGVNKQKNIYFTFYVVIYHRVLVSSLRQCRALRNRNLFFIRLACFQLEKKLPKWGSFPLNLRVRENFFKMMTRRGETVKSLSFCKFGDKWNKESNKNNYGFSQIPGQGKAKVKKEKKKKFYSFSALRASIKKWLRLFCFFT